MARQQNKACHEFRDEGQMEVDKLAVFWALFQFQDKPVDAVTGKQPVEDQKIKTTKGEEENGQKGGQEIIYQDIWNPSVISRV